MSKFCKFSYQYFADVGTAFNADFSQSQLWYTPWIASRKQGASSLLERLKSKTEDE